MIFKSYFLIKKLIKNIKFIKFYFFFSKERLIQKLLIRNLKTVKKQSNLKNNKKN